jgi:hypothetical protein
MNIEPEEDIGIVVDVDYRDNETVEVAFSPQATVGDPVVERYIATLTKDQLIELLYGFVENNVERVDGHLATCPAVVWADGECTCEGMA